MANARLEVLFALAALALVGCDSARAVAVDAGVEEGAIQVGLLVPLTGPMSTAVSSAKQAAELAAAEINEAGGVLGRPLRVTVADDGSSALRAKQAASQLIADGAVALVGPSTSDAASAVIKEVTVGSAGRPVVSYAAASPALSTVADNALFFRTVSSDAAQGEVAADYAHDELEVATAGVLYVNDLYGKGLAQAFKARFEQKGGQLASFVSYPARSSYASHDFSQAAAALLSTGPELVFLVTYIDDGARFTHEAAKYVAGYHPTFMGCGTNRFPDFVKRAAAGVVEGMVGVAPGPVSSSGPEHGVFAAAFFAKHGVQPAQFADGAYDAIYLLAFGLEKAGQADPSSLGPVLVELSGPPGDEVGPGGWDTGVSALKDTGDLDYQGASGPVDWSSVGEVGAGSISIWRVKNGAISDVGS
jgi:branched-chain amino acid transport system substrate-binding protein